MKLMDNHKIKMCFVFDSINYGGAVKLSLDIIHMLLSDNFDISIVSLNNTTEDIGKLKDVIPQNVKTYIVNVADLRYFKRITHLKKIFCDFDIIHSCLENANFYTGLVSVFLRNKIYVSSVHGLDGVFIEDDRIQEMFHRKEFRKYLFYVKYLQTYLFKNFDRIFACCDDTGLFLKKTRRVKSSKIKTVHYGYHYPKLNDVNNQDDISKIKSAYNLNDSDFIIGYVGRVTYGKGLEKALDEIIELVKTDRKIKYFMVGSGELMDELKKKINDNSVSENIFITGYVNNIVSYYKILDLFLLPSMSEGIPLVVEEAMYLGVPVLTSNAGGLPEIVLNGITGITFRKGDFEEMKNLIREFAEGNYDTKRITAEARNFILENYNLETNYKIISKELNDLYDKKWQK